QAEPRGGRFRAVWPSRLAKTCAAGSSQAASMILYQSARTPAVRFAEQLLAGRRVAVRAQPYAGNAGTARFFFDPIERIFSERPGSGSVAVGPFDAESWRSALGSHPAGAVLVGPCDRAERVRGAYRAAVQGAALSGRGAYLLDPEPEALPENLPGSAAVAV